MTVRDILVGLGYNLRDSGSNYQAAAIYRNGDNKTALSIDKNTGVWYDFVEGRGGNFQELISKTVTPEEAKNIANGIEINYTNKEVKLKHIASIDEYESKDYIADYKYWVNRGISEPILRIFPGGVLCFGSLKNRYTFIIKNSIGKIVGLTGRDITGKSTVKWKHRGKTSNWVYPLQINKKEILSKNQVIIVESIGDMLSLFEVGINNVLVSFGTNLSNHVIMTILKLNPDKVIITLNNDKNLAGNRAADKMKHNLSSFINGSKIEIKTIKDYNDFNEMLVKNGKERIKEMFL